MSLRFSQHPWCVRRPPATVVRPSPSLLPPASWRHSNSQSLDLLYPRPVSRVLAQAGTDDPTPPCPPEPGCVDDPAYIITAPPQFTATVTPNGEISTPLVLGLCLEAEESEAQRFARAIDVLRTHFKVNVVDNTDTETKKKTLRSWNSDTCECEESEDSVLIPHAISEAEILQFEITACPDWKERGVPTIAFNVLDSWSHGEAQDAPYPLSVSVDVVPRCWADGFGETTVTAPLARHGDGAFMELRTELVAPVTVVGCWLREVVTGSGCYCEPHNSFVTSPPPQQLLGDSFGDDVGIFTPSVRNDNRITGCVRAINQEIHLGCTEHIQHPMLSDTGSVEVEVLQQNDAIVDWRVTVSAGRAPESGDITLSGLPPEVEGCDD